jgi:RNA-directed DNA polymerase
MPKRIANLWPTLISEDNFLRAYYNARKGKSERPDVLVFDLNLEHELYCLRAELIAGTYQPGRYRQFTIYESKPRLISAAPFRDRVVHHALMNVLEQLLEKRFYYHSYACRKNKGVHKAVDQYQKWANNFPYVMKLDISRYFPSLVTAVLLQQLDRIIKVREVLELCEKILNSYPQSTGMLGLPIGNLTSQYWANLYLTGIDHWLAAQPACKGHLRYVDDLIIFGRNKEQLWKLKAELESKLQRELGLCLHPFKQTLQRTSERVDVLGYVISRDRRWLRNVNGYRYRRKLKKKLVLYRAGRLSKADVVQSFAAWVGHSRHAESKQLIKQLC